jgi:2-polyprenyl-6-methoxyphenol hydroxylase-like FAD-dependent oxidoreductase
LYLQGLWDEWLRHRRAESDVKKLLDSTGKVYFDENTSGNNSDRNRPEIDRQKLRDILLNSVTSNSIKWGKKLRAVEPFTPRTGLHDLHFEDASIEQGFHLVVGADGAWSKARPPLTQEKPFYCGVTAVMANIHSIRSRHPKMARFIGAGSCLAYDHQRMLATQVQGDGNAPIGAMLRLPETWIQESGIDWESPTAGQQFIDQYFPTWIRELTDFFIKSDEPLTVRPLYTLPAGIRWEHKPG